MLCEARKTEYLFENDHRIEILLKTCLKIFDKFVNKPQRNLLKEYKIYTIFNKI